jgi:c-di-GMP-binding flagellar brake protein YcgR
MGQLSDLSAGGCRVATSVPLALGDPAVFTMFIDNGLIMVSGRVVAVGANSVSVRFENMTASTRDQLDAFLASLNKDRSVAHRTGHSASPRSM